MLEELKDGECHWRAVSECWWPRRSEANGVEWGQIRYTLVCHSNNFVILYSERNGKLWMSFKYGNDKQMSYCTQRGTNLHYSKIYVYNIEEELMAWVEWGGTGDWKPR